MLLYTARDLGSRYWSPPSGLSVPEQNIALESFLLHFRNLRAFLCPSLQTTGDDDAIASDFLGRTVATDVGDAVILSAGKQRLDRMLAHLSYSREKYIAAGDGGWRVAQMTVDLLKQLEAFLAQLPPQTAGMFPRADYLSAHRMVFERSANGPVRTASFTE